MVVYTGYFLCDCILPAQIGLFPDDDRHHSDAAEFLELAHAGSVRSGYRPADYADSMACQLQRREHRQTDKSVKYLREMVPPHMRDIVPGFRHLFSRTLLS